MQYTDFNISHEIVGLITDIDEFKGAWRALKQIDPERLNSLKQQAIFESAAASIRLEGFSYQDEALRALLNEPLSLKSREDEEAAGIMAAMKYVFEYSDRIPLTETHLKQLHALMSQHISKATWRHGKYKELPNNVEGLNTFGKNVSAVLEVASPNETPRKMQELISCTLEALQNHLMHPLFIIPIFIAYFLAIRPFQNGNGKLSRIMMNWLLLRSGYSYVPYMSLEHILELEKEFYYLSLHRTQMTLKHISPEWEHWILFFLKSLVKQKDLLKERLAKEHENRVKLPTLSMQILDLAKTKGRLTISQIEGTVKAKRSNIKSRLKELVINQYLVRSGKGRSCWYTLGEAI